MDTSSSNSGPARQSRESLRRWMPFLITSLLVIVMTIATGCETSADMRSSRNDDTEIAQLFRKRCVECHALPAPSAYSDLEWRHYMEDMGKEARLSDQQTAHMLAWLQERNGR